MELNGRLALLLYLNGGSFSIPMMILAFHRISLLSKFATWLRY